MAIALKKVLKIKMYSGKTFAGKRVKGYAVRYPDGSMSIFNPKKLEAFSIDPATLKEVNVKQMKLFKDSTFREY